MTAFAYRDGHYFAEDVALASIAESCQTPFYCYSRATIEANYRAYATALQDLNALICYAIKANSNQAIIGLLANLGAGADVVSEGELRRALAAGIPGNRIVYAGVGKTTSEIEFALRSEIRQFNVESEQELRAISDAAVRLGTVARVAFRINPDIDAGTHAKISTGKSENKFGISIETAPRVYAEARSLPGIEGAGIDLHIGSQITRLGPFEAAFSCIAELVESLRADGHEIDTLDLGGGLGVRYNPETDAEPSLNEYARIIRDTVGGLGCRLIVEPGRSLVADAGVLVSRVIYTKSHGATQFLIIDAGMNDFMRPSIYDAYHGIVGETESHEPEVEYDVVGPVCETGDTFARRRKLPPQQPGDLVVIEDAGAYGSSMGSNYNTRPLPAEILVDGSEYREIRKRQDYDSILARDLPWEPLA